MAKHPAPKAKSKDARTGGSDHSVLGVTKDGVSILSANSRATHFTPSELREAVASVVSSKKAG